MRWIFLRRKVQMIGAAFALLVVMAGVSDYAYINSGEIITFSKESGFYEDSFYLEIKEKEGIVFYYTMDGSRPNQMSRQYTGPILVEDASSRDNIYSARKDVCLELLDKEESQKEEPGEISHKNPDFPVDKCNIIRVAAYEAENFGGGVKAEATAVYFVGFQEKRGYTGIMKVSLVTEPDHLFDYESGIYVMGKRWDEYTPEEEEAVWAWDANYQGRGIEWERPAQIDVFGQNGEKIFSSNCGIRIHGGATRSNPQKSFSVFAREEYGGDRRFAYDLFGNRIGPHKFILSSGGNDDIVKIRDCFVQEMTAAAGLCVATMKMFPCMLFLNGEYWGTYYITESYDSTYIQDYYDVAEDNVVIIKEKGETKEIEEGNSEDLALYYEMQDYITGHDMQDEDAYQKACEMVDIDSFVDFYALQIYIGNGDWPGTNVALWRARDESGLNIWTDGRWRYMVFDTNHPSVLGDPEVNNLERALEEDPVFASLMQNDEVEKKFCERIRQLENEVFKEENVEEAFEQWFDEMSESVRKSDERYFDVENLETIPQYLSSMKWFLYERPEYMEKHMLDCLGE